MGIYDGLVGWWKFNGDVRDLSGNGHNGTVSGATLTTDRFDNANSAYNFNNNRINITDSDDFTLTTDYTIMAWINNTSNSTSVWKGIIGTYNGSGFILALQNTADNRLNCWTGGTWRYSGVGIPNDGTWKHVAFRRVGSVGTFFVDGVLVTTTTASNGTNGGTLQIGGGGTSWGSHPFYGDIDDVRIYNRGVTDNEIKLIANSGIYMGMQK